MSRPNGQLSGINMGRVIVGGLVAGLLANGFDFAITTLLMSTEFADMMARLNAGKEPSQAWIAVFGLTNFLWGLLLVFTYAAIRPRFGSGPRTAVIGATILWLVVAMTALILLAMGLHTIQSYAKSATLYLVSALVCSVVGAALYREKPLAGAGV